MKRKTGCLLLIICWSTLCFAQQVVVTDLTVSGNGTSTIPPKIGKQSAAAGQVSKLSGTSKLPAVEGLNLPFKGETSVGSHGINISHTANSGINFGGQFISLSTSGRGVYGDASAISGRTYGGYFGSHSNQGIGALGITTNSIGTTYGIYGTANSTSGTGVYGHATAVTGATYGGYFESSSTSGIGVSGKGINPKDTACGTGVYGEAGQYGVFGKATANRGFSFGGYFMTANSGGRGVMGAATSRSGRNYGGYFYTNSTDGYAVYGYSSATSGKNYGGYFQTLSKEGAGVIGIAPLTSNSYSGLFYGNVVVMGHLTVVGEVSKSGGSFEIDHPLDPENKTLRHSFVESPDMMNVYNGNIITDGNGSAVVILPDYFEALNKDFRYQLTVIGEFAQAIIAEKMSNNRFTIRTDKPKVEVSWQITGVRQDPWAKDNRMIVEEDKELEERGYYLYPKGYKQPENRSVWFGKTKMMQEIPGGSGTNPLEQLPRPTEMPELEIEK